MEDKSTNYETNIMYMLQAALHHWYIIVISTIIIGIGAFIYAKFFITPIYTSTVKLYVNNESTTINDYISSGELMAAQELVNTYIAILDTPDTLGKVIEKADLEYSTSALSGMITSGSINNTAVFYVSVHSSDPLEAYEIANTICDVLPQRISEIIEKSSVMVVQNAEIPTSKSSPNITTYTLVGMFCGFLLGAGIIIINELANNSINDENYPTITYDVRTLAYIPSVNLTSNNGNWITKTQNKKNRRYTTSDQDILDEKRILCEQLPFNAAEAYVTLRTNIESINNHENIYKVIGVTSSISGEGKSTLAINYSYTLAKKGKRVLLVEADMRKPVLVKRLGLRSRSGLSDMLNDDQKNAIQESGKLENWKILSAGAHTKNPSELLASHAMEVLFQRLRQEYDVIIVDLPPVNEVSDPIALSMCLDGLLYVVKQSETTKLDLQVAMHHMAYSRAELIGFVITNACIGGKYGEFGKYGKYYKNHKYRYYQSGAYKENEEQSEIKTVETHSLKE